MRTFFLPCLFVILFSSCASKTLYDWGDYSKTSYNYYKQQTKESEEALISTYLYMINGINKKTPKVPPGTYCEYGYFLIQKGYREKGIECFKREKKIYPESTVFMDYLIKHFSE